MRGRLRRIAAAGNAAALVLLAVVLAWRAVLFGPSTSPLPSPGPPLHPGRVLLVVIDALRVDRSLDPELMPHLNRLAAEGRRGTAVVESWVPSTVAGIRTLVEGVVPPPASFLEDFGTTRSKDGGIFTAFRHPFVAGASLWQDLYGPWLTGTEPVSTFSGDDDRVLGAGLAALGRDHDLVVVHLGEPDAAAHRHGASSSEYAASLARSDAALGRLLAKAGPGTAVLVTSDHGVTERGGHAGPEPDVRQTPVVARGLPGLPAGGTIRQSDIPRLLLGRPLPAPRGPSRPARRVPLLLTVLALAGCLLLARRLPGLESRWPPAGLNAALWIALALAVLGLSAAALAVALAALAVFAFRPLIERASALPALIVALHVGLLAGGLRLADGLSAPGRLPLLGVCLLGVGAGLALRPTLLAGGAAGLVPAVLTRFLGETASLSTLDVRLAFQVVDGPLGLPGAVGVVVLLQALPPLAVALGASRHLGRAAPEETGAFAAGVCLTFAGQAGAASLALAYWWDTTGSALAVGLLVRLVGEVSFLFLGLALAVRLGRAQAARRTVSAVTGQAPLKKVSAAGKNSCGRSM